MQAGSWLFHVAGIDWAWEMSCDGHDYVVDTTLEVLLPTIPKVFLPWTAIN